MPLLTKKEKDTELKQICEMLNSYDFIAEFLPKGNLFDESCVFLSMPTDDEEDFDENDPNADLHMAVMYLLQLDPEEEAQMTKYLLLVFKLLVDISSIEEAKLYKFINEMNQFIRLGTLFVGEDKLPDGKIERTIQYKHLIGASTDENFDEGLIGEAIIEMGFYYDEIKERVSVLLEE